MLLLPACYLLSVGLLLLLPTSVMLLLVGMLPQSLCYLLLPVYMLLLSD